MINSHHKILTAAAVAALILGSPGAIAEEQPEMSDLSKRVCKDVMILDGEDRVIALALLHGYRLGKKGTTQYAPGALGEISDKFMDHCLDNPGENALAAFEKIAN